MVDSNPMSRRERQIMDIVYAHGDATVRQIQESLDDPPTVMAVRRMMHILEEKGHLKRRKQGREVVYRPRKSTKKVGLSALSHVVDTFFGGAIEEALAAHLASQEDISPSQLNQLQAMIADAKRERKSK